MVIDHVCHLSIRTVDRNSRTVCRDLRYTVIEAILMAKASTQKCDLGADYGLSRPRSVPLAHSSFSRGYLKYYEEIECLEHGSGQ